MTSTSETVLVIDADSSLTRALCAQLDAVGYRVVAHVRTQSCAPFGPGVRMLTAPRAEAVLASGGDALPSVDHIVFGPPFWHSVSPAAADFEALVVSLESRLMSFLAELQAAGRQLARRGGQIWVITLEDSMHYYANTPSLPIDARARHAAVKSFAKEVLRFGVRVNCANVQPVDEQIDAQEWRFARDGLKTFAMKFKPNSAASVANVLRHFLAQPDLPIAGMVVPLGVGFAENNI